MKGKILLIGLTGRKQSGKDTFCGHLQTSARATGQTVARLAIGDLLKAEVAEVCGVTVAAINADKARYRPMLQWWGTDFRRHQAADYWVAQVRERLRACARQEAATGRTVIHCLTDARFADEAGLVREFGGVLLRVVRPQTETPDAHASETAMAVIPVDATILNDGCPAALAEAAAVFWSRYCTLHI